MWSTEIIVFSTKISWQTCQLYFFTFIAINLFPHRLSAIETPFLLSYRLKIRPRLILYVSNSKILVRRSTRPYSLSARRSNKISSYEKRSHRLWTNSALFTNLNMTCAMQVILVSHAAICINVFKNTETRLHWLASIFATSILWPQGILRRILMF